MVRHYFTVALFAVSAIAFAGCSKPSAATPAVLAEKSDAGHEHAVMPEKLATDEEIKIFLTPGGLYTEADILANGKAIPVVKYRGIRPEHSVEAKPGEKICPISETKANPKYSWMIGGSSYEFCCVPCIEEFVGKAKTKPGEIKPPEFYRKK